MVFKRFLKNEGPLRKLLEERIRKGPILKRLREQFFKSSSKVYDAERFNVSMLDDIKATKGLMVIISPFLNKLKVERFINAREVKEALGKGKKIIVVTRPPNPKEVENINEHKRCIEILRNAGIKVVTEQRLHFKSVIIDNEVIYLGSINPLSIITIKHVPPDYMVRFESEALVDEIIENAIGRDIYEKWLSL